MWRKQREGLKALGHLIFLYYLHGLKVFDTDGNLHTHFCEIIQMHVCKHITCSLLFIVANLIWRGDVARITL